MFKWPGLVWSVPGFSDEDRASVCPREPWRGWKALLTHRAMGSDSLEEYRRWIAPGHMVNALALLYCVFFYGNNRIPRFNLSNSRFSIFACRKRVAA